MKTTMEELVEKLEADLAASQAREAKLRRDLQSLQDDTGLVQLMRPDQVRRNADALALPTDDTALREWGAKLLTVALKRCNAKAEQLPRQMSSGDCFSVVCELASDLRAGKPLRVF